MDKCPWLLGLRRDALELGGAALTAVPLPDGFWAEEGGRWIKAIWPDSRPCKSWWYMVIYGNWTHESIAHFNSMRHAQSWDLLWTELILSMGLRIVTAGIMKGVLSKLPVKPWSPINCFRSMYCTSWCAVLIWMILELFRGGDIKNHISDIFWFDLMPGESQVKSVPSSTWTWEKRFSSKQRCHGCRSFPRTFSRACAAGWVVWWPIGPLSWRPGTWGTWQTWGTWGTDRPE